MFLSARSACLVMLMRSNFCVQHFHVTRKFDKSFFFSAFVRKKGGRGVTGGAWLLRIYGVMEKLLMCSRCFPSGLQ